MRKCAQDMVLAGMTQMQVIVAATRNSAEFLRLADTGTLEAGKSANFVVLDANPCGRHHEHAGHRGGDPPRRGSGATPTHTVEGWEWQPDAGPLRGGRAL